MAAALPARAAALLACWRGCSGEYRDDRPQTRRLVTATAAGNGVGTGQRHRLPGRQSPLGHVTRAGAARPEGGGGSDRRDGATGCCKEFLVSMPGTFQFEPDSP